MARPNTSISRNLTLTEELERLEQSITLTLQEIDHNFSRAHRIVTTSIIPIVQQYAEHSNAVWKGSEFWKQFFEASANVSLTGYEEAAEEEEYDTALDLTQTTQEHDAYGTPSTRADDDHTITETNVRPSSSHADGQEQHSSILDSPSVTLTAHGTPQRHGSKGKAARNAPKSEATFADYPSPYETLKREITGKSPVRQTSMTVPTTPGRNHPFYEGGETMTARKQARRPEHEQDPLLHRMLDKNYRVLATPHSARKRANSSPSKSQTRGQTQTQTNIQPTRSAQLNFDSSPFSPPLAAPQLRSEFFDSPVVSKNKSKSKFNIKSDARLTHEPLTPGVSVQTQNKRKTPNRRYSNPHRRRSSSAAGISGDPFTSAHKGEEDIAHANQEAAITPARKTLDDQWDDDLTFSSNGEEADLYDDLGMSPPKTMQFHIPTSRLLRTPAKEASRRIVEDLLDTARLGAGGSVTEESFDNEDIDGDGDGDGERTTRQRAAEEKPTVRYHGDLYGDVDDSEEFDDYTQARDTTGKNKPWDDSPSVIRADRGLNVDDEF